MKGVFRRFRWHTRAPETDRRTALLRAAYRQGCRCCIHNATPGEADIDGCELGADWDEQSGCPYWRWNGRLYR